MSITDDSSNQRDASDRSRRAIFIVAGLVGILLIVGLIVYLKTRPEPQPSGVIVDQKLEGGLRAGSPDFEKNRDLIRIDEPIADYSNTVAGDIQMSLGTTVRNFTGRTINGLEMRGAVVDFEGKTIKERTKVVIPSGAVSELEHNGTAKVPITISGFVGADKAKIEGGQAVIRMEVTAIRFK
jgi:hypothetical protein